MVNRGVWTALGCLMAAGFLAAEWPEFRGPTGQGISEASGLPLTWSETENVTWKTSVPGLGWSSPVVGDRAIWLTTATDDGRSLRAIRLGAVTGEIERDIEVFRLDRTPSMHNKNSHASPTAVLEGDRVYVHYGTQGTAALDLEGKVLWRNQEQTFEQGNGTGGSPVLAGDLLIFSCDGTDRQYMIALNKHSGQTVWQTSRGKSRMAFSTPLVISGERGDQVVSTGGDRAVSYDAQTGRELWWITYDGFSLVPRPVFGHGLVFLTSGFHQPLMFAIRPDGRGDITGTEHVVWERKRGVPLTPSPLLVGDELYFVSDNGIATCVDARTGAEHWRSRLGGSYSASPLYAEGRIYFQNEDGGTTVIRARRKYEELAKSEINGRTLASMAVAHGAIFLRSDAALYRIEKGR